MDDQVVLRWRRSAWGVALAAIVGMAVAGTWLWIPHRDPLVWEFVEKVRPLLWGAFLSAILAGASATYFLTVTDSYRKRRKRKG